MKILIFSFAIIFSGILLVIVCPTTAGRVELDEHVILLFTFDRDSGKTIKDGSKQGNDGKVIGSDKLAAGKFSKAFEFDGETYIEVEKSDTLDITDQITAAAWIYRIGPSQDNDFILDKRCQGCGGGFELVVYRPEMNEAAYFMVDTDAGQSDMSGPTVKVNEWHHIAGVYDGSEIRLYVDGELTISKPRAGKMGTKSNLYIGIEEAGGKPVSHLVGRLDEICISNIARTAAEIKASMSGFSQVTDSGNSSTTWGLIKRF